MIELTKISTERAHRLFGMLRRLGLLKISNDLDSVEDIFNEWKYAERHELQKKQTRHSTTDR